MKTTKKHILKIYFILLAISLTFSACLHEPETLTNNYRNNFDALWKIIDTRYCYLDYKHINWDSIYNEFESRIDDNFSENEFFDFLADILGELQDGHVNLYSDFNLSRYWKWYSDYPANFSGSLLNSNRYLGQNYKIAGGMRYTKIAGDSIAYIYYGDFTNRFSDKNIAYIFKYFQTCEGLIIDVRNNGGGYLDAAEQLASYFFDEDKITGYMAHKIGAGHSDFSELKEVKTQAHKTIRWQLPVAILTNRMSYSATNAFISKMKGQAQVIVVGDKSGGGGGLPFSSELPNGWMVRFSAVPMYDANKQHIEWGIDPDFKVDMQSADQESGVDTIIEKAIEELKKKAKV